MLTNVRAKMEKEIRVPIYMLTRVVLIFGTWLLIHDLFQRGHRFP